jgi:acetyl esterase/lipase
MELVPPSEGTPDTEDMLRKLPPHLPQEGNVRNRVHDLLSPHKEVRRRRTNVRSCSPSDALERGDMRIEIEDPADEVASGKVPPRFFGSSEPTPTASSPGSSRAGAYPSNMNLRTPSLMTVRNKPPPIDTIVANPQTFDWAENLKPDPKRSAIKFGSALIAFCIVVYLLGDADPASQASHSHSQVVGRRRGRGGSHEVMDLLVDLEQSLSLLAGADDSLSDAEGGGVLEPWRRSIESDATFHGPAVSTVRTEWIPVGGWDPLIDGVGAGHDVDEEATVQMRLYSPDPARGAGSGLPHLPVILYLHGGGYVGGSIDSYDGLCRTLAAHLPAVVASVGYRLAPEHKFPGPLRDALAAARWLQQQPEAKAAAGVGLALVGDDAGGSLAASIGLAVAAAEADGIELALKFCASILADPMLAEGSSSAGLNLWQLHLGVGARGEGGTFIVEPLQAPQEVLQKYYPPTLLIASAPGHEAQEGAEPHPWWAGGQKFVEMVRSAGGKASTVVSHGNTFRDERAEPFLAVRDAIRSHCILAQEKST